MTPLTRQQLYDRLVKGADDGVLPSYDPVKQQCKYDGGDGHHCAVGLLLADLGLKADKDVLVEDLDGDLQTALCEYTGLGVKDLSMIQDAHDLACFKYWKGMMPVDFRKDFIRNLNNRYMFHDVRQTTVGEGAA